MNIAVIVAGGVGSRISSDIPKQFIQIKNKEMLVYTLEAFNNHEEIDSIVIATLSNYIPLVNDLVKRYKLIKVSKVISGGLSRQESVRNALNELKDNDEDIVLIHDGDRPLINKELISKCIEETKKNNNAIPYIEMEEFKSISNSGRKINLKGRTVNVQTPQCFFLNKIKNAHNRLTENTFPDDASILENENEVLNYLEGDINNFKITTDIDLIELEKRVLR